MAKLRWRKADAEADSAGAAADGTVWATAARQRLFALLDAIHYHGMIIRIRHRYIDEAFLLVSETRYRDLERRAGEAADHSGSAPRP